ncbi:hypothetical protein C3709_07410 [Lelliottia aquatilis]|uniref:Uncharacterized protein n=1 Tax=Lelliottia aquatilis TaxID=2080838 RepID=A0ABX5A384_9ENTR|nr:hypothetical protein C3Z09_15325 [Lelliottia aquatilis]POZ27410.1 hypothetical protein C3708_07415 [Lelliottia sp. 7254-16]POZ24189.1 hypothetical protein C3712_08240 [Lelliottia aquatilis]POZ29680.1 hypothetical protein C3711_00625 [Lelliottia aquatilis]POZ35246.1 hypothetical protein C3710_00625 [Lelliottia aquatilis]
MAIFISGRNKKSLHQEAFWRCFSFHLSRASPLNSGAKVKEEAENSSIHACVTLCFNRPG